MKKILFTLLLLISVFFAFSCTTKAQQINAITSQCQGGDKLLFSSVRNLANGDIAHTPCPTFASVFYGNVDFSNATIIGTGFISGNGTTNYVPRFTGASAIGNTPLSWNGTSYDFNNTNLNSEFTLSFRPNIVSGYFQVGDFTTTPTNYLEILPASNAVNIASIGTVFIGDFNAASNNQYLLIDDASQKVAVNTDNFVFSSGFGTATANDCAGLLVFDGSGLASLNPTGCQVTGNSIVLTTYESVTPRVTPITASNNGAGFDFVGDANARFFYFIVNRQ